VRLIFPGRRNLRLPSRAGEPSARFPKPWTVARWVDGEPADHIPISSPKAAGTLAGFLRALHRTAPGEAPANPNRGVPLEALEPDFDEWFTVVASSNVTAGARRIWEQAVAAPAWQDAPVALRCTAGLWNTRKHGR
jgi:hypothetical protein